MLLIRCSLDGALDSLVYHIFHFYFEEVLHSLPPLYIAVNSTRYSLFKVHSIGVALPCILNLSATSYLEVK